MNNVMYVIDKWNDDGEEENTTEAGEHNENEVGINTGRLAVKNTRLSCLHKRLWLAFHDEAPSLATVYNWFNEFKRGCINLIDDLRERRPSMATTEGNITDISTVRLMIETDKRVTYQQIWITLGIVFDSLRTFEELCAFPFVYCERISLLCGINEKRRDRQRRWRGKRACELSKSRWPLSPIDICNFRGGGMPAIPSALLASCLEVEL
ncbi:hypothetical protein EVAR_70361_1 [Eumeta japonica]|uniref:Mos1 transposase HTH domain-containing protein n=1 Tax=Eumeta variegata TaxID=151549 RepID=A0A4C1ZZH6_EUMVA|nr:hypothetical protein EVAR_70361_1 [Eumeta japonica]